jgi:hypothetical protein
VKLITALLALPLMAQNVTLTPSVGVVLSSATVKPGGTVTVSVIYTDISPSVNVAGLQWTLSLPSGQMAPPTVGTVATAASKTLNCNGFKCLVVGVNANVIGSGTVAQAVITAPTTPGPYIVAAINVVGANLSANAVTLTTLPGATFTVTTPTDVNGDGKVDITDLQLDISQILGLTACGLGDVNGDGSCDVLDAEAIIKAILGP